MKNLNACFLLFLIIGASAVPTPAPAADGSAPTVLITGANRGLGLEFARQYDEAGWQVIGTARKPESATDLQELGATVLQLDVTDDDSVARLAEKLDGRPIDMLINNAGILPAQDSLPATKVDTVAWILDVNTLGPLRVTQALLPNLENGDRKTIINISSGLGSIAQNQSGRFYGYRESKAALNMFSRTLAAELGSNGFIVVAMDPGWVQTDMGGEGATITTGVSINGMLKVFDGLTTADSGRFLTYDGSELPW